MTDKTKQFLQKLKDSGHWNDDYDYSKVEYVDNSTKVLVIDKRFMTEHLIGMYSLLHGSKCVGENLRYGYTSLSLASEYVHTLGLNSHREWKIWCRSGDRPHNISSVPDRVYKNSGWVSWGDWFGTGVVSTQKKKFSKFEQAREYVRSLNLKNQSDWLQLCKSDNLPDNIPKKPRKVYIGSWLSMGDWLGTKIGFNGFVDYIPFEKAREYVRSLNLKNQSDWYLWRKSHDGHALNIPANPETIYKNDGWLSLSDWLGTKPGFQHYLPFGESREYVRKLSFERESEYLEFCNSGNKPDNIPNYPRGVYINSGWISMGDYLGYKIGFDGFLSFSEAKEYVSSECLVNVVEWNEYCKTGNKPDNIPSAPDKNYISEWVSWSDWLGYMGNGKHNWSKNVMLSFIKSLKSELTNLESVELITIINSNNLSKKMKEIGRLEDLVSSTGGSKERQKIVNEIINTIEDQEETTENETQDTSSELGETLITGNTSDITEETTETALETLSPTQELHTYDNNLVTSSLDVENIDFLMKNQLKKIWNKVLNDKINLDEFREETGGDRFTIIKNWFFDEYEEVNKMKIPEGYIFKYQPNLMQKLITYRLVKEKRYGNWSGTGAGKTLSAIFAGRYSGAKNTVIICNNSTVEGWVNSINEYFSNNKVYTKRNLENTDESLYTVTDKSTIKFNDTDNNYLILNYETFQQEDSEYVVSELLKNNRIDYIIMDEVQNVKQREDDIQSTRRDVVNKLLIHASEKNDNLMVMAMSATPIINNLTEPKKLIELLTGESHTDLETDENILNGIEMYKALTRHGLRYKPDYGISVNEEIIEVDGSELSDEIIKIKKGAVVEFEKVLIDMKLDAVSSKIKKGTLIYTHYVTELSQLIGEYITDLGFTVGYYTGQDKSGLRLFKEGKIDVLVGSAPVGTGVDGIQNVCNTLIPIILPWTSSEYDQLVGRVNRQGSNFDHVNIYIPQVIIPLGDGIWSWDKRRHNIIKFKATLADLAIDGKVPKNLLPSRTKLIEDAKKELSDWVNRLQSGDIITFDREEFMIPLNPKQIERSRNKLGDFSDLNKNWSVSRSDNTHERLSKDPSEWYYYHTLYSKKRKTWTEIPYIEIAKKIKPRTDWVVGDFGCGENLLSKEITNHVHAFDHVAVDDDVISCDIKNVPIEDGILDVAVFSLALMGSNHMDYFKEAYRTLKTYGNIFVCEPASKWEGREDELKEQIESVGFKCFNSMKNTDKFIYIDGVKY